ncbi:MAG: CPBP family glutamic-type intramembrane protease [Defluviitaleaceae bacterium]|nr:CPBP family glutamic-type intramembrane protease [Defluviitaleaceae bacterium]
MNERMLSMRLKLLGLFTFLILLWLVNSLIPTRIDLSHLGLTEPHAFRLVLVFHGVVIATSAYIIIIRRAYLKRKYIIVGVILGILSMFHFGQFMSIRILMFSTTLSSYIAASLLFANSEVRMITFKKFSGEGLVISILAFVLFFVIMYLNFGTLAFMGFIHAFQPGISEEVVFRMFLFSLCIFIIGGKQDNYNKLNAILINLILIIPFAIYHVSLGTPHIVARLISLTIMGLILTSFAIKRDLFSAILVHVLMNTI